MTIARRRDRVIMLGVVLTGVLGTAALLFPYSADCVTMDKLLDGEKIVIGDKSFENWKAYQSLASGGALPVPATEITVSPLFDPEDPLISGLEYATDKWTVKQGEIQTTTWTYDVRTISGSKRIKDTDLHIGASLIDADGSVRVTEAAFDATDNVIATMTAVFSGTTNESGSAIFPPQNFLRITTTVVLNGGQLVNGHASTHDVIQRVSQIPGPSTLWLVSTALAGLIIVRRRERGKHV